MENTGDFREMSIGELVAKTGVTHRTIRYYVAEGLLSAGRLEGKRRFYTADHVARLALIRRLKGMFLPLREIRRRIANMPLAEKGTRGLFSDNRETPTIRRSEVEPELETPPSRVAEDAPRYGEVSPTTVTPQTPVAVHTVRYESLAREHSANTHPTYPFENFWHRACLSPNVELNYTPYIDDDERQLVRQILDLAEKTSQRHSAWGIAHGGKDNAEDGPHGESAK